MIDIILASKSPRRVELLEGINIPFKVIESDFDETTVKKGVPSEYCMALAHAKAMAVADKAHNSLVIGSDTIVVCDGEIIGKPKNNEDAYRILSMLQGRQHEVITGLAMLDLKNGRDFITYQQTTVVMRALTKEEIGSYIQTKEPMDKAGAYGIQGIGSLFIEKIEGDYYTVMGLPLGKIYEGLKLLNYDYFSICNSK